MWSESEYEECQKEKNWPLPDSGGCGYGVFIIFLILIYFVFPNQESMEVFITIMAGIIIVGVIFFILSCLINSGEEKSVEKLEEYVENAEQQLADLSIKELKKREKSVNKVIKTHLKINEKYYKEVSRDTLDTSAVNLFGGYASLNSRRLEVFLKLQEKIKAEIVTR